MNNTFVWTDRCMYLLGITASLAFITNLYGPGLFALMVIRSGAPILLAFSQTIVPALGDIMVWLLCAIFAYKRCYYILYFMVVMTPYYGFIAIRNLVLMGNQDGDIFGMPAVILAYSTIFLLVLNIITIVIYQVEHRKLKLNDST